MSDTDSSRSRASGDGYRADIQGLRGVAVLVVVLYHAGVGAFAGGYAGVDVFFVISGFLITGLILQELETPGGFSFLRFYARRARRILPAATLVLVATVLTSVAVLPPLQARSVTTDALSTALFVANYRFAGVGTDYLTTAAPSPLQHYWSLCIEEQFYLLWPALLIATVLLGRRLHRRRAVLVAVLAGLAVVSCAVGVRLTDVNPPWGYFSLASRGWELAVGGLIAVVSPAVLRWPRRLRAVLGWLGLLAIGVAVVRFTSATAFPGYAALLPVLGAAAVLVAGGQRSADRVGPGLVLRTGVLRYAGSISYSWYLWHWPVLTLTRAAIGRPLSVPAALGLCAVSALLAAFTLWLLENPVRRSVRLRAQPAMAVLLGAVLVVGGVTVSFVASDSIAPLAGRGAAVALPALAGASTTSAGPHMEPRRSAGAAPSVPSEVSALQAADARVQAAVTAALRTRAVPANLEPSVTSAAGDKAAPFVDGCNLSWTDTVQPQCSYTTGMQKVVLFGDSHAAQWFPPLRQVAERRHWQLESWTKTTCPPNDQPLFSPYLGREYTECEQWRTATLARIRAERPTLVVLGVARHYGSDYHLGVYDPTWDAALASTVRQLRASGAAVLVMGPTPKPPADVPTCVSAHLGDVRACDFSYASAVNASGMATERRAVILAGGSYLDVPQWVCTSRACAAVIGNLLVYRDDNHLTTAFTGWLAPALDLAVTVTLRHRAALPY